MFYSIRHPVQTLRSRRRVRERLAQIAAISLTGLPMLWVGCQAASLGSIV